MFDVNLRSVAGVHTVVFLILFLFYDTFTENILFCTCRFLKRDFRFNNLEGKEYF